MDRIKLVCPCLLGVEGLVADELRAMEAQECGFSERSGAV